MIIDTRVTLVTLLSGNVNQEKTFSLTLKILLPENLKRLGTMRYRGPFKTILVCLNID